MLTKICAPFLLVFSINNAVAQDIFEASRKGDSGRILELVQINPDTVNAVNSSGFQPLMIACYRGQVGAARTLIESGAQINGLSPEGNALLAASYQGNVELTKLLLEHHANPNVQGPDGNSAIMYAVLGENVEMVKLLLPVSDLNLRNKDHQTVRTLAEATENREIRKILNSGEK